MTKAGMGRSVLGSAPRFPTTEESEEWVALRAEDFKSYKLEVGGLVREPVSLSLDDLKAMPAEAMITMHTCMQGWTGIAKWTGVRLRDVLALVEPTPEAKYVMGGTREDSGYQFINARI
jgi:sulfoxide reductase catalytic subunit YedY